MPSAADLIAEKNPDDLRTFLEAKLDAQVKAIALSEAYYNGEHKLAFATAKFREAFARYFPPIAINWMKVVVDTAASRLKVMGFRFDPDPSKPDWELDADDDAWRLWQASNMDTGGNIVITDAIKYGVSYVMVVPPVKPGDKNSDGKLTRDGMSRIVPEHPNECFVYLDPEDRASRLAGIKRWKNEIDGFGYANVFTPDQVYRFRTDQPLGRKQFGTSSKIAWGPNPDGDDDNPIGVVPLIVIENKPDLEFGGRSDLEEAIPIQDAINKTVLDMIVSSEFHAFPQRYATGWQEPVDESGNALADREVEVRMGATRLLTSTAEGASFGQFSPGNVDNYIKPIEQFLDTLSTTTATPGYSLRGNVANISADTMHAADADLVDRCRRKIDGAFSDNFEDIMCCAFLAMGDKTRGTADTAEVIWAEVERRSISQNIDAAVKMRNSLNVPIEMCWQMLGWTPQQIRMARDMMGLPPGGPGSAADNSGDITVNEGTGRLVDQPIVLGPNGQPLPAAQQPAGAGGTQPNPPAPNGPPRPPQPALNNSNR